MFKICECTTYDIIVLLINVNKTEIDIVGEGYVSRTVRRRLCNFNDDNDDNNSAASDSPIKGLAASGLPHNNHHGINNIKITHDTTQWTGEDIFCCCSKSRSRNFNIALFTFHFFVFYFRKRAPPYRPTGSRRIRSHVVIRQPN